MHKKSYKFWKTSWDLIIVKFSFPTQYMHAGEKLFIVLSFATQPTPRMLCTYFRVQKESSNARDVRRRGFLSSKKGFSLSFCLKKFGCKMNVVVWSRERIHFVNRILSGTCDKYHSWYHKSYQQSSYSVSVKVSPEKLSGAIK